MHLAKKTASCSSVYGPYIGLSALCGPWALKSQQPGLKNSGVLTWRVQMEKYQQRQGNLLTLCQLVHLCKMEWFCWFQYSNAIHTIETFCFICQSVPVINLKFLFEPDVYFTITWETGLIFFSQWMALNSNGSVLGNTFPVSSSGVFRLLLCYNSLQNHLACWVWLS